MDAATPDTGRPAADAVVLTLSGTPARDDGVRLEAALSSLPADVPAVVLECRDLGGMSADMATVIARWWRRFADTGRSLRVRHANVVVRWVLERHLGSEAARRAMADANDDRPTDPPSFPSPARPRRDLAERLRRIMSTTTTDGAPEAALSELLREAGLAERVRLVLRQGDRLVAPAEEAVTVRADGWLGSLLAGADCPVTVAELRRSGLSREEEALLLWSGADVIVPLGHAGDLVGLLLIGTGRPGGWSDYRSGEVLALDLVAHLLAGHLGRMAGERPAVASDPAPDSGEAPVSPSPSPAGEPTVTGSATPAEHPEPVPA